MIEFAKGRHPGILSTDEEVIASKIYCQFEAKSCDCSMTAYDWQVFAKRLQGAWGDGEPQEQRLQREVGQTQTIQTLDCEQASPTCKTITGVTFQHEPGLTCNDYHAKDVEISIGPSESASAIAACLAEGCLSHNERIFLEGQHIWIHHGQPVSLPCLVRPLFMGLPGVRMFV